MGLKDTCNWTKHNFCCFCSQCDPWKERFTYSNIFSAQTDLNIYKQAWFRIKRWFQFFFQSLSNFWNPFKDVEKQCHGRPAIGGHLTNQFCQRGGQDFQHISQNQILSFFLDFCWPPSQKSILPRRKMRISRNFKDSVLILKRQLLRVELSLHLRSTK